MAKCPKCEARKGKRPCPALATEICSRCCGEHRMRTIECPKDCVFLEGLDYESQRRQELATRRGDSLVRDIERRLEHQQDFQVAMRVSADIFFASSVLERLSDASTVELLDAIERMFSPVVIAPAAEVASMADFIFARMKDHPQYDVGPGFGDRDRVRVLQELKRRVASLSGRGEFNHHEDLARYFGALDPERDLGYTEADVLQLHGQEPESPSSSPPGFRRSSGGLILPE